MRHAILGAWLAAFALVQGEPARAQEAQSPPPAGEVAVGAQTTHISGDESRFREDSLGERKGLELDFLRFRQIQDAHDLDVDARFTAGGSGWLDMDVIGDRWRVGLRMTRVNSWSVENFADDFLPSGRPVSTLFPGTTTLYAPLSERFPRAERVRAEVFATWRFNVANRLTLRVGSAKREGNRVPSVGGFSFGGGGNPAFYTAGIEHQDSTSHWASLELKSAFGPIQIQAETGTLHREDAQQTTLPVFGRTALLGFNRWGDRQTANLFWLRLDSRWQLDEAWAIRGGAAYVEASSDPRGEDWRLTPSGEVERLGLSILSGHTRFKTVSGALGFDWRPSRTLSVTFAADTQHAYGDGRETLALGGLPWAPADAARNDVRVGGTARLVWHRGGSFLRMNLRGSAFKENDLRESRGDFFQQATRTTDRWDARLDFATPLSKKLAFEGWARYREEKVSVDDAALRHGYLPGDWKRRDLSGQMALRYRMADLTASLSVQAGHAALDQSTPLYDPIFDPSLSLVPLSSDQRWSQAWGQLAWALQRGSVWVEAGWLQSKYEVPVFQPVNFAPLSETVSGTVTALGGETSLWTGGILSGQAQWVKNRDRKETELVSGSLRLEQRLSKTWSTYLRWGYWNFSNPEAPSAGYTAHVITAGLRAAF